jgi:hypothetical protein
MMDFPIDIDGLTFVPKAERNKYDEEKLYVIGGSSCAMIDRRGAYISDRELQVGDTLVMRNMGHYVDVTFSWFNGIIPPNIVYRRELPDGSISEERITNRKASHVLEIFGLGSNR